MKRDILWGALSRQVLPAVMVDQQPGSLLLSGVGPMSKFFWSARLVVKSRCSVDLALISKTRRR